MSETIFDKIIKGEIKSWKVWEDSNYLAFLTPFPNTPGLTIVIPNTNVWSPHKEFNKEYQGWLTTAEGLKMSDEELDKIQEKILMVQK